MIKIATVSAPGLMVAAPAFAQNRATGLNDEITDITIEVNRDLAR